MEYIFSTKSNSGSVSYRDDTLTFISEQTSKNACFSMQISLPWWDNDAYLLIPACAYNGNRFKKSAVKYPPMYEANECGASPEPIITDVPALGVDGSGKIEVTTGDASVPCIAVFSKKEGKALFIFTEQACKNKNIGYAVETGLIELQFPAMRQNAYTMCASNDVSKDSGVSVEQGETIQSKVLIKTFPCESTSAFFRLFFENRRALLSDKPAKPNFTKAFWDVMETHMNRDNFNEHYYAEMSKKWQSGWVGGGMSSLPLLQYGNALTKERAISTLDYMTSHVSPIGFFYTMIVDGVITDDGFGRAHMKNSALTRKLGDALYFLFKHFDVIEPKKAWVDCAKNCADAFVKLFNRYGDFGQFINVETGDMLFGGTTSGAPVIGALVRAFQYFKDETYLEIAKLSGENYYQNFVARGLTYGGPGEALCAPDSESAYAMVESMTLLYEETRQEKWLNYACDALHLLSSWVMPYSYQFPAECEFARLNVNTVGSVFANVQNKHSAPGLCTASGDAIYKLYKYTGNKEYLQLLRDVAFFIPQCVSTDERPIYSWDNPPIRLRPGIICERVNTSDWETSAFVGGVFNQSCWPETSLLLTYSELIWKEEIAKELLSDE